MKPDETTTILLIEDEDHISDLVKLNLEIEGYEVIDQTNAEGGLDLIQRRKVDLVIMDVMLPGMNGMDACRKVKSLRPDIPVLILSALGQSTDKIKGLRSGADDYLSKPFNLEELILRVQKLIARYPTNSNATMNNQIRIGKSIVNFDEFTITNKDKTHSLSSTEIDLLKFMYQHKNTVLSRQKILENVWGYDVFPNTRTIDNFISSFRKYIEEDPSRPEHFISVRGVGYKLSI